MARTKRKENNLHPKSAERESGRPRILRACGYIRLSVEDGGRPGADTVQNQKELVRSYIEQQEDLQFCGFYCDNGLTGTDFDRPEFARMIQDAEAGKLDCIVVKDLSRFGRSYLETGHYLERMFPSLGVRFVAVSDQFDTQTAQWMDYGSVVPLKNLINELYSRELSKKVSLSLARRQQQGEFIGAWAPYGYQKCADHPHQIEPDQHTAGVVQEIFRQRLSHKSCREIAEDLNTRNIPSPSHYHYLKGELKNSRFKDVLWQARTVRNILANQVYLGHMVQGRKRASFYEGKKQQLLPESEWAVVLHTHQPIIEADLFQRVKGMKS